MKIDSIATAAILASLTVASLGCGETRCTLIGCVNSTTLSLHAYDHHHRVVRLAPGRLELADLWEIDGGFRVPGVPDRSSAGRLVPRR